MADCFIEDDFSIRIYRSVIYMRVQKSGRAILYIRRPSLLIC